MFKWLILATLATSGPASASSSRGVPSTGPGTLEAPVVAAKPKIKTPKDIIEEKKEEKSAEQKAAEERLKAIEAAESQKVSRAVILKWPESDTDHTNEALVRNIKARIARPDAKFYPEIDLYQSGRKEPDDKIRPADQRALVPDDAIDRIMRAVEEVATIPWNALAEQDWNLKAYELRELAQEMWFLDRPELREPTFLLYAQIGRAAENSNNPAPPFYEAIGGKPVNYYWFLAGAMANEEPGLMSKLTDQDMYGSIGYYKDGLDRGDYPSMTLSFELEGRWDPKAFAAEYQVFINGLERVIKSTDGLEQTNAGRVDVYLARADGHSLSERVQLDKLEGKVYFVRDVARKRMGKDFIDMLMLHPNECSPEVDGDILNYLSIYAKLHPEAEIYIGLAKGGSIAPRNIYLWRWDRVTASLQKVLDDTGGFPVRFVGLVSAGMIYNGATYERPDPAKAVDQQALNPDDPTAGLDAAKGFADPPKPTLAAIPVGYHLRGHYNRLMVTTGIEFAANIQGGWSEMYQTQSWRSPENRLQKDTPTTIMIDDPNCDPNYNGGKECDKVPFDTTVKENVLKELQWQRLVFVGAGVVLGRNAAIGFGPRGYIRTGWYNAPHALDLTLHLGHAAIAPFAKQATGRVRPILDADLYGGVIIPFRDSVFVEEDKIFAKKPLLTAGATVSAGLTF